MTMADSPGALSPSLSALASVVLEGLPGVEHLLLSNLYGLPIIRASSTSATIPVDPLETIFATVFAMTAEQLEKLGLGGGGGGGGGGAHGQAAPAFLPTPSSSSSSGPSSSAPSSASAIASATGVVGGSKARYVVACHGGHVLVQAALHPLVLALVARPDADVDAMVDALPQLLRALEPLRRRAEELTGGG